VTDLGYIVASVQPEPLTVRRSQSRIVKPNQIVAHSCHRSS
jgi:hypothetical protein